MQILTVARWGAVLVFGVALAGGCKKEPQKTEAPPPAPASAPSVMPAPAAPIEQVKTGEALFKQYCAVCHPNGGNSMKPELSLHGNAMAAHNITKPEDIVKLMRHPGPGMTKFDEATIPDKDAIAIAQYIQDAFK
jgi:cytochrome c6